MAGLLYYLPGATEDDVAGHMAKAGLTYAYNGRMSARGARNGPEGTPAGLVVADNKAVEDVHIGHFPNKQTWRKVPGGTAWVGYYPDDPPKPADLVRKRVLRGRLVTLGDGQDWVAPIARGFIEEDDTLRWYQALPETTTVDDDGNWIVGGVLPKYAKLWDLALRWLDATCSGERQDDGKVHFDFAGLNDAALVALGTNYRLGKAEVALLGLFNGSCAIDIMGALIDTPTLEDFASKKKQSTDDGSNTADGQPVETPATAPP